MKKILILFPLFIITFSVSAGHLMGGDISTRQISGLTYEVTLVLYRDISGIFMPPSMDINYKALPVEISNQVTLTLFNSTQYFYTSEEYIYKGMVTFPSIGIYDIRWAQCCRNSQILNTNNPSSQEITLYNILTTDTVSGNSTPEFLNQHNPEAYVGYNFTYNPLPFDIDGDSIVWSIDTPQSGNGNLVYWSPSALPGNELSINSITGEITWVPTTVGMYISAVIVEEFRNNVKIGETTRDMQFIVLGSPPLLVPSINTNNWPLGTDSIFQFNLQANSQFTLTIDCDTNNFNLLNITALGEPLMITNPAIFTNIPIGNGYTQELSWQPTNIEVRIKPYIMVFRIDEYLYKTDISILLRISDFTSVNENSNSNIIGDIYPNPTKGKIFIPVTVKKDSDLKITFLNQLGQDVKRFDKKINTGQNLLYFSDLNLLSGIYFVNLYSDGKMQTKKIVIE